MASIGGISVFSIKGAPVVAKMQFALKSRPGVAGNDVQLLGLRGDSYTVKLMHDVTSEANLYTAKSNLAALQGTLVTLVTDLGQTHTGQMVEDVKFNPDRKSFMTVGGFNNGTGSTRFIIDADITLRDMP